MRLPYADGSIDCVITSPPYFALRAYQDGGYLAGQIGDEDSLAEYLERMWAVMRECWRVLAPWGVACVVIGDSRAGSGGAGGDYSHHGLRAGQPGWTGTGRRGSSGRADTPRRRSLCGVPWRFALGCMDGEADPEGIGWVLVSEIIWSKMDMGMPESVADRPRSNHEQVFVFAKNPTWFGDAYAGAKAYRAGALHGLGRVPGDVFSVRPGSLTQPDFLVVEADGATSGISDPVGLRPPWEGGRDVSPAMRGIIEDAVLRQQTGVAQATVLAVRHYAAFPPELVAPLVQMFSPEAVCLGCHEPRRRVLGQACAACGSFVRRAVKACPECGHRRIVDEASLEALDPTVADRRDDTRGWHNGASRRTTAVKWSCGCADTTAGTRPGRVLDPMCGSGTVPTVADSLGRIGYGSDLSGDYTHLASWRQTVGMDDKPVVATKVAAEQASLFGVVPTADLSSKASIRGGCGVA